MPLSIVVTGANRHDASQLLNVLQSKVLNCNNNISENLCADAGYTGILQKQQIITNGYIPRIRSRKEEKDSKKKNKRYKARRWIVEVTHSWFNRFRKILVRFEKLQSTHLALLHLAAAIITLRKVGFIYG